MSSVIVADHISHTVRKHRLLDDKSTQRFPAVSHVLDALHSNIPRCSVAWSAHQRRYKPRSECLNDYLLTTLGVLK